MIFMSGFCNAMSFDLDALYVRSKARHKYTAGKPVIVNVGLLAHAYLKNDQGIRGIGIQHRKGMENTLMAIIAHVNNHTHRSGWDLRELTGEIWTKIVQKRDWAAGKEVPT
jgi:hypothetical protein